VLFIVGTFADPPKTVKVGVQASWNSAPLALEASEFLYEAEPSLFWEYFESFQVSKEEEELTDTVSRSMAVNLVKERLSPLRSDLLDFALHTRQLSPRVEMVRKAAASELPKDDDTCIFMFFSLFEGKLYKDAESLTAAIQAYNGNPSDDTTGEGVVADRVYSSVSGKATAPKAYLYGNLVSRSDGFRKLHSSLKALSDEGKVTYIFRHHLPVGGLEVKPVEMVGYGVELAIKNMEYKAVDDREV